MSDPFAPASPDSSTDTFVISKTENGFKVYSPTGRTRPATVIGVPDNPSCSCADFRVNADDPEFRCAHIEAVLARYGPKSEREPDEAEEQEERAAIREEHPAGPTTTGNGQPAQMLLKRSVSPDGRIDSLSIEFTCRLNSDSVTVIAGQADEILALQDRIARGFLGRGRKTMAALTRPALPSAGNGSVPATILGVGGTDGRFGRRMFLRLQVGDRVLRFYGGARQLGAALNAAGYPEAANAVAEGLRLDLPCRVVTAKSASGGFINVERVLPVARTNAP